VYDVAGASAGFNKELSLYPIPNRLISCDWKRSFDRTLNKFIDLGVIVGQRFVEVNGITQPQWDIYTIDFDGNCNDYLGPILPPSSPFMFTDVRWHPILPEIIVTAKYSNTDYGYIYTLNIKTGYVNKTLSSSTLLNGIDFEPNGDYAIVVGHGDGGTSSIPMILGYIYPYVAIDTSGSYNPVYGSRWLYGTTGEAGYAEVGRGSILYRFNAGQETKNNLMTTDPLNPSTFNDGLLDGYRLKLGFQDADNDGTPNFLDNDADNDGILNGEEAYLFSDFDNDSLVNVLDNDSDNDGIGDFQDVKVVFRTNAINDSYNSSIWIGVETDSSNSILEGYLYNSNITIDSSSLQPVNYTLLGASTQIHTPKGYLVYKDTNYVYIDIPGPNMIRFSPGSIPDDDLSPITSYALSHKETYNCTGMLSDDADNDGLPDITDPNPSDPDVDDDGIKDGYEINWNESIDDDGLPNYNDVDSDNDGLPDGWIDGWGYNATAAELHIHANGTIDGYGVWYTQDGIKQPWEGEDLNLNSMVDENETNPINSDTDNDGFLDGEEIAIYGTNPVTGWDYDGDGLSDYDELYGFYPIDIVNIVEYMNTSRDSIAKLDQDGWYGPAGWYGIANNDTISIKFPFNTTYHIWTEPTGSTITINGTTFEDATSSNPAEIDLEPGIYNISFTSTSFISKLFIAKRGCNISNPDTDNDGIPDGYEIGSPLDRDSDNDGLLDSEEQIPMYIERLVPNGSNPYYEKVYGGSFTISSPMRKDSDNDGLSDKYDPCRMEYETMGFPHSLYPPYSIVENRTFRGWGLNGHSWIIHRDGSIDDRGTTDVKVSNMSDLDEVRDNIIKILPKWYDIPPSYTLPYTPLNNLGDALNGTYYNETWETYDFTGYPIFRINYTYQANLYNVT
ncbi:hypothetical protein J7L85_00765, partial [candidate division WOR-3 bacterium]|nr:hypothetical protein [candidate division WOR-3 bacterium]